MVRTLRVVASGQSAWGDPLVRWGVDETLCDGVVAMYVLYTIRWTFATISIVKTLVAICARRCDYVYLRVVTIPSTLVPSFSGAWTHCDDQLRRGDIFAEFREYFS